MQYIYIYSYATVNFKVGLGILLVHRTKLMAITDELDLQMYLKEITMKTDLQAVLREAIAALDRLKCGSGSKKIPQELQSYITPPGGGTFVAPPMLGFTKKKSQQLGGVQHYIPPAHFG